MKKFKYVFLIIGIIYLAEVVYTFIKPKIAYEILSFDIPLSVFVIFKLIFSFVFIMLFRQAGENKG